MRRARVAALALLAVLAAGCGGSPSPPAPHRGSPARHVAGARPQNTSERLQALLDRRARALRTGAASAYAATSTPSHRAADRRAARDAGRLGLTRVTLYLRGATVRGRRATLHVAEGWSLRGVRGLFQAERLLRAVRGAAGDWRIAGAAGTRSRDPWEVGDFRRRLAGHFVVLAPAGLDVAVAGLPAALADGYASIGRVLPRAPLRRRYLAVVAGSAAQARAMTVGIRGVEGLAAIADNSVRQGGPAERVRAVLSQRLLVVWPAFASLGADERRRIVTHELTHLVLAPSTSGRAPAWLIEGVALYVSGDQRTAEASAVLRGAAGVAGAAARTAFSLRRLSEPGSIARLSGAQQAGAYDYASAAAYTLASTYGPRALLRLLDAFSDPSLPGHAGPSLVSRAMRRTVGESLAAFEARLRASLS